MGKIIQFLKKIFVRKPDYVVLENYLILMRHYGVNYLKTKRYEINFNHHEVERKEPLIGFEQPKQPEIIEEDDEEMLFWSSDFKPKKK